VRRNRLSAAIQDTPELESISPMLDIDFAEASDCGPVRPHNEDFVGHSLPASPQHARSRGWLFVLADGVGGQDRGEIASRLTVETLLAESANSPSGENSAGLFARAIQSANTRVYEAGHGSIASTLVACILRFDRATVAHVGDSRCYLIRHGRPRRLTRDHTVLNEQSRFNVFSAGESQRTMMRSVLNRSIGNNLFVAPEISEHHVIPGDLLLLCSDGLHGAVSDHEIARIATSGNSLQEAVQQLIWIANQNDGGDNVSVQLIRVKEVEAVGMYRGRPYRLH
jgi:serine/threonine protein phosphatase PrpC